MAGVDEIRSLSEAIRSVVEERIDLGVYLPGTSIPSEHELAMEFDVSRLTARSALDELVDRGLLVRAQGRGTFVSANLVHSDGPASDGFRHKAMKSGTVPSVRILDRYTRPAGRFYANIFGIDVDSPIHYIRRLNSINGEPRAIESTYIPLVVFPGIDEVDIAIFSLYDTYAMRGHTVAAAAERLGVARLTTRDARLLGRKPGAPALTSESLSYDAEGTVLEYVIALNRDDAESYLYHY